MNQNYQAGASPLRKLTDGAERFLLWVFTVMLVTDVLLGILARYVQFDVVFADELGKYLFIWLCLIGISAATRDHQHVRLTFIASKLPISGKVLRVVSQLLFLIFSLIFFYLSAVLTRMHFVMDKTAMGFPFPMYFFTAALPAGFALTCIRLIQDIVRETGKRRQDKDDEPGIYASKGS